MSNKLDNICRLCLKVAEKGIEIDEIVKQMFEILLIKLDLGVTKNPIICQDCMVVGKKCLSFKFTCIDTEKFILSYSAYRKEVEHNIKVIYEERKHMRIVFDEQFDICRICMTHLERNDFAPIESLMNERMFEMSKYVVEMDFSTIESPIICANCIENLEGYVKFLLNCLDIEKKIKAYWVKKGTDLGTDEVRLGDVLQFMLTDILEYPEKCSKTYNIEQSHVECAYPEAYNGLIKQEELDIKNEGTILNEKPYRNTSEYMLHKDSEHNTERRKSSNMQTDKHATGTHEKIESENMKTVIPNGTPDFQNMYQFSISNISDDWCVPPMFKCSLCSYESKHKYRLQKHTLVHKDISEINMFKCSSCTYESKYKGGLKSHMLIHKDVSKMKMFKCSLCTYEGKRKRELKRHILIHKDVSKGKMFKCDLCRYESKHKSGLKSHMLVHQNVSGTKMFKCPSCTYETKRKGNLNMHMLVHKNVSEMEMFKCSLCAYECKRNDRLRRHMSTIHKDILEVKNVQI